MNLIKEQLGLYEQREDGLSKFLDDLAKGKIGLVTSNGTTLTDKRLRKDIAKNGLIDLCMEAYPESYFFSEKCMALYDGCVKYVASQKLSKELCGLLDELQEVICQDWSLSSVVVAAITIAYAALIPQLAMFEQVKIGVMSGEYRPETPGDDAQKKTPKRVN